MKKALKPNSIFFILLFSILTFFSCRKEAEFIAPSGFADNPQGNFDAFWNGIDQNYVFFEYDNLDWDKVYAVYKPKVTTQTSDKELSHILGEMFSKLIDGHRELKTSTNLFSAFNGYTEKYPLVNADKLLFPTYIDTVRFQFALNTSSDQTEIYGGVIRGTNIILIKVQSFSGKDENDELVFQNDSKIGFFDDMIKQAQDKGFDIILDVRNNGGGDATEFYQLVSRFLPGDYTWAYSRIRLERDRNYLSPPMAQIIKANSVNFTKKLVVLTNRYSFSAAELTALALKGLPNVTVIGDTTGGANGPISSTKEHTGNFIMPNGWQVQLAQRITLDKDKRIYEGKGLPPHQVVKQSQTALNNGRDNVLDVAIESINK